MGAQRPWNGSGKSLAWMGFSGPNQVMGPPPPHCPKKKRNRSPLNTFLSTPLLSVFFMKLTKILTILLVKGKKYPRRKIERRGPDSIPSMVMN